MERDGTRSGIENSSATPELAVQVCRALRPCEAHGTSSGSLSHSLSRAVMIVWRETRSVPRRRARNDGRSGGKGGEAFLLGISDGRRDGRAYTNLKRGVLHRKSSVEPRSFIGTGYEKAPLLPFPMYRGGFSKY